MTADAPVTGDGIVDLHSHLIPGVDDGAADERESAAALEAFSRAGVVRFAATPHLRASFTRHAGSLRAWLDAIDIGWERLSALVAGSGKLLQAERAAEIALDAPDPDLSEPRLRLGGGPYVLVEFPFLAVPPHAVEALRQVCAAGWRPVLAHPERYEEAGKIIAQATAWKAAGAVLQVNGPSLLGRFGPRVKARAEALLYAGLVDYVASDFHARGSGGIADYVQVLGRSARVEQIRLLTTVNPTRILAGEAPIPVGPVERPRGLLAQLFRRANPSRTSP